MIDRFLITLWIGELLGLLGVTYVIIGIFLMANKEDQDGSH